MFSYKANKNKYKALRQMVRNINTQGHSKLQQPSHCEKKNKKNQPFFFIFKGMHLLKILTQFKIGTFILKI